MDDLVIYNTVEEAKDYASFEDTGDPAWPLAVEVFNERTGLGVVEFDYSETVRIHRWLGDLLANHRPANACDCAA